jgi:hypothetical protein
MIRDVDACKNALGVSEKGQPATGSALHTLVDLGRRVHDLERDYASHARQDEKALAEIKASVESLQEKFDELNATLTDVLLALGVKRDGPRGRDPRGS